jgi:uncharacterized protein (DUF952 family)
MEIHVTLIYKIASQDEWRAAQAAGQFDGAPIDLADGYIHFSTGAQAQETADKHFAGRGDLLLIALDDSVLGDALKWEPSRGGQLFPHLYRPFLTGEVLWAKPLPIGADGLHDFAGLTS